MATSRRKLLDSTSSPASRQPPQLLIDDVGLRLHALIQLRRITARRHVFVHLLNRDPADSVAQSSGVPWAHALAWLAVIRIVNKPRATPLRFCCRYETVRAFTQGGATMRVSEPESGDVVELRPAGASGVLVPDPASAAREIRTIQCMPCDHH